MLLDGSLSCLRLRVILCKLKLIIRSRDCCVDEGHDKYQH